MREHGRGTGRTTRMLERAVKAASDGETVAVFVHSVAFATYCERIVRDLCLGTISLSMLRTGITMLVHGGGLIRFMTPDRANSLRGLRVQVFVDHYVYECSMWHGRLGEMQDLARIAYVQRSEDKIDVGSTVRLRSGGPIMTVTYPETRTADGRPAETTVRVMWFEDGCHCVASLPPSCLEVVR